MRRKAPVPFGKGPTEKDPHCGHLAGGLLHSEGGPGKRTGGNTSTAPGAYLTAQLAGVGQCAAHLIRHAKGVLECHPTQQQWAWSVPDFIDTDLDCQIG